MVEREELFELLNQFVPRYLLHTDQEELIKDLRENFPNSSQAKVYNYLVDPTHLYQGDIIEDVPFPLLDLTNGNFVTKYYNACILSNTCDIASENKRIQEPNVTFGPVIPLKDYIEELSSIGISRDRINSFLTDLRQNKITNLFHLPAFKSKSGDEIHPESFIRFDYPFFLPLSFIEKFNKDYVEYQNGGDRVVSLSNYGFYLLLFKLSVHFCRIREGVFRN